MRIVGDGCGCVWHKNRCGIKLLLSKPNCITEEKPKTPYIHSTWKKNLNRMQYTDNSFYLCHIPLSAEGPEDVAIIQKCELTENFPELFIEYEKLRSHATNNDGLYSVIRADDIYVIIRTNGEKNAKVKAFEDSRTNLITNLQHRVMQNKDENAQNILKSVYLVETEIK